MHSNDTPYDESNNQFYPNINASLPESLYNTNYTQKNPSQNQFNSHQNVSSDAMENEFPPQTHLSLQSQYTFPQEPQYPYPQQPQYTYSQQPHYPNHQPLQYSQHAKSVIVPQVVSQMSIPQQPNLVQVPPKTIIIHKIVPVIQTIIIRQPVYIPCPTVTTRPLFSHMSFRHDHYHHYHGHDYRDHGHCNII